MHLQGRFECAAQKINAVPACTGYGRCQLFSYFAAMNIVKVSTPFNIHLDFEVAPLVRRIGAWWIDALVLVLYAYIMRWFIHETVYDGGSNYPFVLDLIVVSLPMLLYHLLMEVVYQGQSLGKMAMGIRVMSLEGGEPHLGQYLLRWIFRMWEWPLIFGMAATNAWSLLWQFIMCSFMGIPVLIIIAVTIRHQRLGDLTAGTGVVEIRNLLSVNDTIFQTISTDNYKVLFPEVMRLSDRDINALKAVITQTKTTGRYETAHRIAARVKEVLHIDSRLEVLDFLEKLLDDYNYLATQGN